MIKVLWLTNIIFDNTDGESTGTWMIAMAKGFKSIPNLELGSVAFGNGNELEVQSTSYIKQWLLPSDHILQNNKNKTIQCLEAIITDFNPSIINIWGTEGNWGLLLKKIPDLPPVLLCMQGIKGAISKFYFGDLTTFQALKTIGHKEIIKRNSIFQQRSSFQKWKPSEDEIIKSYQNICVQSQWTAAHIASINKDAKIYHNEIVLRQSFYDSEQWNLKSLENKTVFFLAAYPAPFKGLHVAIQVIAQLKVKHPQIMLRVAGWHPRKGIRKDGYVGFVVNLIEKLGVVDNVVWLGSLDSPAIVKEMHQASVLVVPSFIESYCVVLAEAMLLGLPAVVSYAGGMTSLGKEDETILFFSPGDIEVCAYQIDRLFSNTTLASCISKNARNLALSRNSESAIIAQQVKIYEDILVNSK